MTESINIIVPKYIIVSKYIIVPLIRRSEFYLIYYLICAINLILKLSESIFLCLVVIT